MRTRTLLIVGGTVFGAVLIITLPASLVTSRLPATVALDSVSGSLFSGGAERLTVNGVALGAVDWSLNPASLARAALGYHVTLSGPAAHATGDVELQLLGGVSIEHATLDLPLSVLSGASGQSAIGSAGRISGEIRRARLAKGWPQYLDATLSLDGLRPAMVTIPIGSYQVRFDPQASARAAEAGVHGTVKDLAAAPLAVDAQITLNPDQTYVLEGSIVAKPNAPAEVQPALSMLGPADPRGRHAFSIGGTL
jgi:general secretion pathway protein N